MKKRDVLIIVVCAIVSALFSYGFATLIFSGEKTYNLKAPKVEPIVADFKYPDEQHFNRQALDPTIYIVIGPDGNQNPFQNQ